MVVIVMVVEEVRGGLGKVSPAKLDLSSLV